MYEWLRRFIYGPPEEPLPEPEPAYDPALEPPPLGDIHRRGLAAVRLLADPTLAEAFAELRAEAYQAFVGSGPNDSAKREEAYRLVQVIELLRAKLIHYRDTARIRQERDAA